MPEILDIFNQDAFSASALTGNITLVPNAYGRINALGLFRPEPIATTTVTVILENGVLNLLPTRPRGAPATLGTRGRQRPKAFPVPHIPHEDSVLATDVQNMLALTPTGIAGLETVLGFLNRKLIVMRNKHAITLEKLRMDALKGVIRDYDGSVILDLFAAFGVTQQVVDFALGTASTDVLGKCQDVTGYMEDNLLGETMTGVHALASPEWFRKFTTHASVKEAFKYYQSGPQILREDVRKGFTFGGITFEEYRGSASYVQEDGTTSVPERFIPAGDVRFFPLGTTDTFTNYWAPPDFWSAVNQAPAIGDAEVFVAPLEPKKFGKGMDIHTESNPLPLVKRPALLVRGFTSN
ncbi:Phage major capsid protein E [Methylobacterium sp. 174MFSha1.1]|uniref:major capsid protein n=1 Tax=Methylobacterium sp. 174MFSha1.1 TaxID=1502749 RepID=UPI0008EB625B|nr:major capsid protein [Methylobacterium sp. 174MFSha1.1]SFV06052.1 Phage major capsid protein E [Methylobacterium sp. 174MFSha1.1]